MEECKEFDLFGLLPSAIQPPTSRSSERQPEIQQQPDKVSKNSYFSALQDLNRVLSSDCS